MGTPDSPQPVSIFVLLNLVGKAGCVLSQVGSAVSPSQDVGGVNDVKEPLIAADLA